MEEEVGEEVEEISSAADQVEEVVEEVVVLAMSVAEL